MIETVDDDISHVIDIDVTWLDSMKKRLSDGNSSKGGDTSCKIYKVPEAIRKGHEAAYDPKVVSIGPYHRLKENLKGTEELKWQCLRDLISRNRKVRERNLENILKEITKLEANARRCYSEDLSRIGSNEFVEMMVLDGCFILQYFLNQLHEVENEPIYTMFWMPSIINHDLILVENQLPFFILSRLFDLVIKDLVIKHVDSITISSFKELAIKFFLEIEKFPENIPEPKEDIHHLLHLLYMGMCPIVISENSKTKPSFQIHPSRLTIPSAMQLQQAGVRFEKTDSRNFLDIKFRNGVMEIPSFLIDHYSDSFFRNLLILEQFYIPNLEITYVTGYAFFMDCIINTSKDIAILQQNRIIENMLESNEEVAILFNQLCKDIFLDVKNSYLSYMHEEVNRYYHTHQLRANLNRDYFSNPWASLSAASAIVLFGLTATQTFFSVYAYFRPP